jgi:hypothetical protein
MVPGGFDMRRVVTALVTVIALSLFALGGSPASARDSTDSKVCDSAARAQAAIVGIDKHTKLRTVVAKVRREARLIGRLSSDVERKRLRRYARAFGLSEADISSVADALAGGPGLLLGGIADECVAAGLF